MFVPPANRRRRALEKPFRTDRGLKPLALLTGDIERCKSEGYGPGHDPEHVVVTLWSILQRAAWLMLQHRSPVAVDSKPDNDRLARSTVDLMMQFIAATRAKGSGHGQAGQERTLVHGSEGAAKNFVERHIWHVMATGENRLEVKRGALSWCSRPAF